MSAMAIDAIRGHLVTLVPQTAMYTTIVFLDDLGVADAAINLSDMYAGALSRSCDVVVAHDALLFLMGRMVELLRFD